MEQQIQDLVDSIRKEGVEKAKLDAERIISDAEAKARAIIEEAEKERDKLLENAASAIATEKSSAEASIRQAARDVSLSLKKSIEDRYTVILKAGCGSAMHGEALVSILKEVISGEFTGKAVEISEEDMKAIASDLSEVFASQIRDGLEFRPSSRIASGFRICEKDGSGYIDMTGDVSAELLSPYLSSTLKALIEG